MAYLLLGTLLILWALQLLGLVAVGSIFLGILALITGIIFVLWGAGYAMPSIKRG
jgi:hypothetical protein